MSAKYDGYRGESINIEKMNLPEGVGGNLEFRTRVLERMAELAGLQLNITFGNVYDIPRERGILKLEKDKEKTHSHYDRRDYTSEAIASDHYPDARTLKRTIIIDKEAIDKKLQERDKHKDISAWAEEMNAALHSEVIQAGAYNLLKFSDKGVDNMALVMNNLGIFFALITLKLDPLNSIGEYAFFRVIHLALCGLNYLAEKHKPDSVKLNFRLNSFFAGIQPDRLALLALRNTEFSPDLVIVPGQKRGLLRRLKKALGK